MRASCTECSVIVAASYLKANMAQIHGICISQKRGGWRGRVRVDQLCGVLFQGVADGKVSGAGVYGGRS